MIILNQNSQSSVKRYLRYLKNPRIISLTLLIIALPVTFIMISQRQNILQQASSLDSTTPEDITLASTYHSISVYAPFQGDTNENNSTTLEYRKKGDSTWIPGMDMTINRLAQIEDGVKLKDNQFKNVWRASILMTQPDTEYEVKVTFSDPDAVSSPPEIQSIRTRSEFFASSDSNDNLGRKWYVAPNGNDSQDGSLSKPFKTISRAILNTTAGDTVYVRSGTYKEKVTITQSGNEAAYIHIRNYPNEHPILDANGADKICTFLNGNDTTSRHSAYQCGFLISGSYIRVNGFEIINGNLGVKVHEPAQNVILEHLKIHKQVKDPVGEHAEARKGGAIIVGNTFDEQNPVKNITIQDNEIISDKPDLPPPGKGANPAQSIINIYNTSGGHVIRRNKLTSTFTGAIGVHGSDCINGMPNNGTIGGYLRDSDIYDNTCIGATDDGISLDGPSINVRVWGNRISRTNLGISTVPVVYGPVYVFRNVVYDLEKKWVDACVGIKEGKKASGPVYFYHNTFYIPDPDKKCERTLGMSYHSNPGPSQNITLKNNIFLVNHRTMNLKHQDDHPIMDYNMHFDNGLYSKDSTEILIYKDQAYSNLASLASATGQEVHGVYNQASFVNASSGDFRLTTGSPGIDQGVIIQGFNDENSAWPYGGTAPDIGAYESGFVAPITPTPTGSNNTPTPTMTITPTPTDREIPVVTPTHTQIPTRTPTKVKTPTPTLKPSNNTRIKDSTPPEINFVPSVPEEAKYGDSIDLTVNATDNMGIKTVYFYINNRIYCSRTTLPYSCNWTVPQTPQTSYRIRAVAVDNSGRSSNDEIIIKVRKPFLFFF